MLQDSVKCPAEKYSVFFSLDSHDFLFSLNESVLHLRDPCLPSKCLKTTKADKKFSKILLRIGKWSGLQFGEPLPQHTHIPFESWSCLIFLFHLLRLVGTPTQPNLIQAHIHLIPPTEVLWHVGHLLEAVDIWSCSLAGEPQEEGWIIKPREGGPSQSKVRHKTVPKVKQLLLEPDCQMQRRVPRKQSRYKQVKTSRKS